jgi:hypothetical protein
MAKGDNPLIIQDGSMDWSGGVNSTVVTTVASDSNPNGLKRTQMAWMDNCTVRDGGISQRFGWSKIGTLPLPPALMANLASGGVVYQGSFIYVSETGNYHVIVVSGHVWQVPTDNPGSAVDLSQQFGFLLPSTPRVYFCQAEQFLVIQAGDAVTLPLFWDGTKLWQSKGITDPNATTASPPHTNEIPAATAMCYYMNRLWYAQGRNYSAGDIVGGPSGTLAYGFRDAVLCVQENPICVGGDGFTVPSSAGNIRGIAYASNINSQLGQGILYIGTREEIYSLTVPTTRTDWIRADANNQPLQVVALATNGWVNDRSIVSVNGDLFFQSLEPSIRSMTTAIRNFHQWGNVPISINENRLLQFTDRSLMWAASGIYYDNRLLETALPFQCPVGIAHKAIIPLNFDVVSSFDTMISGQEVAPVWEGMLEGLDILELTEADYGGNPRAFSTVWSEKTDEIELWEFSNALRWDEGDHRVVWYFETPAWTFGDELALKKLVGAEVWIDKLVGEVVFHWDYRPDGYVCWTPWIVYKECAQANPPADVRYPQGNLRESYRQIKTLPTPPVQCNPVMARPSNQGHQFQLRVTIKGFCRVRGIFPMAELLEKGTYQNMVSC